MKYQLRIFKKQTFLFVTKLTSRSFSFGLGLNMFAFDEDDDGVFWGTQVSQTSYKSKFKMFLDKFIDVDANFMIVAECCSYLKRKNFEADQPLYAQVFKHIYNFENPCTCDHINISMEHLKKFDEELYRQTICYPQAVFPIMDSAVNEIFKERYPDLVFINEILVRPFNVEITRNIRTLNPENIDQLITITGMVLNKSNLIPVIAEAFFR